MNWLPGIFRRGKVYGDLAEEMRLHLEERPRLFPYGWDQAACRTRAYLDGRLWFKAGGDYFREPCA